MRARRAAAVAAAVLSVAAGAGAAPEREKPNILLIVADDLGWADVGWHGGPFKTPNVDRLAKEGVILERHYVQPVCSPTRAALLSGRWTSRFGPHALAPTNLRAFPEGTVTLATALKACGYTTCLAGKWHLGSRPEWCPNRYGFEHSYGSLAGAVDPWEHTYREGEYKRTWHRDGVLTNEAGNATELIARQACEWIRASRGPWFVYVPFQAVHIPIDAPQAYKDLYAAEDGGGDEARADALRRYGGFVSQMDAKVGEFVRALDETGQRGRTLIVFTSDNGGTPALANAYAGGTPPLKVAVSSNVPLRGVKNQLYEGGVRVAAFAHWQGRLAPRRLEAPLHAADWMPTLTGLAGWKPERDPAFDGRDIWPLLTGADAQPEPRTIYIPTANGAAVLYGEWKLIVRNKRDPELYRITHDPYEAHDVAAQEPAQVKALQERLAELRRGDLTELPADLKGLKP
jgi:arylsulfatase A-like enzyme